MAVYFIRDTATGAIKIGHARDPWKRHSLLQTGCPTTITLVGVIDGDAAAEADLHTHFAALCIRGEWFRCEGELAALVAGLPAPKRHKGKRQAPRLVMERKLTEVTGADRHTVRYWMIRGRIPAWHWTAVARAGLFTLDELAAIHRAENLAAATAARLSDVA